MDAKLFIHEIASFTRRLLCYTQLSTFPSIKKTTRRINKKGFTLIEMLIVIAIIGILSTAGSMAYIISRDKARVSSCVLTMNSIRMGLEQYISDYSIYPDSDDIASLTDAKEILKGSVDFSTHTTCEDPLVYTSNRHAYTMETTVHFTGAPGLGVKIIIDNGEIHEEDLL